MMNKITFSNKQFITSLIFFFVNGLFILKYSARASDYSFLILVLYLFTIVSVFYLYRKFNVRLKEKHFRLFSFFLLTAMIITVSGLLINIDPMSVRVDRWSAVTYFIDSFINNNYPYGAHTHVSTTNFPSPFPIWYVINLPFYLLGDVGIGLIFFLILIFAVVKKVFNSYKVTFLMLLLFALSPAYWWEVIVRSDSLSNAFFVISILLLAHRYDITLRNNLFSLIIICTIIACTRLSAIIPVCIFFFRSYINLPIIKKLIFPLSIIIGSIIIFSPFIFWDTTEWIFFKRNPFMSQTGIGNPLILLTTMLIGIYFAFKWKLLSEFIFYTGILIFIFMLLSQVFLIQKNDIGINFFESSLIDISYFTLSFPYVLLSFILEDIKRTN